LVEVSIQDYVATLWLNRPDKRNAMSNDMRAVFIDALTQLASDRSVRALVLTGRGEGFCAGSDVSGMKARLQAPAGELAFNGWSREQQDTMR
jgi:enoyl-CoA hydratase/carnithine racemase